MYRFCNRFLLNSLNQEVGYNEWSVVKSFCRDFVNTRLLIHKHVKISVDEWILETTRPQKHVKFLDQYTGQERLIRSHSSARFCFELSGNSN